MHLVILKLEVGVVQVEGAMYPVGHATGCESVCRTPREVLFMRRQQQQDCVACNGGASGLSIGKPALQS